jgi:hypothetical protein
LVDELLRQPVQVGPGELLIDALVLRRISRLAAARGGLHRRARAASGWKVAEAETQRFVAERMKARVRAAPVDHMPMLTAPPVVIEIVLEPLREVEPGR